MEGEAKTAKVEGCQKFLKKYFKKVLTRESKCDIIEKLSRKRRQLRTLKIEQQTNLKEERNPEIPRGH